MKMILVILLLIAMTMPGFVLDGGITTVRDYIQVSGLLALMPGLTPAADSGVSTTIGITGFYWYTND